MKLFSNLGKILDTVVNTSVKVVVNVVKTTKDTIQEVLPQKESEVKKDEESGN